MSKPERDLADAVLLLELTDSGTLKTEKPVFEPFSDKKRLDVEEEYELARRIQVWGDVEARNRLVMAHAGLVGFIVSQMLRPSMKYEDLLQEGILGLIRATETFQPDRNIRFSTYGVFWIRAKIQRFIQSHRVPKPETPNSRTMILQNEPTALLELLSCDLDNPEERLLKTERMSSVKEILSNIIQEIKDPYLKTILERRTLCEEPESFEELGQRLDISREKCRLLESKMLKLAKEQLASWR